MPEKAGTLELTMKWHKKILYFDPRRAKNFPAIKGDKVTFPRAYGIALLHMEPEKWSCKEDVKEELKQHAISEKRKKDILAGKVEVEEKKPSQASNSKASKGGEK